MNNFAACAQRPIICIMSTWYIGKGPLARLGRRAFLSSRNDFGRNNGRYRHYKRALPIFASKCLSQGRENTIKTGCRAGVKQMAA